jgi:hypothetical protein
MAARNTVRPQQLFVRANDGLKCRDHDDCGNQQSEQRVIAGLTGALANWGVARVLRGPGKEDVAIRLAYV